MEMRLTELKVNQTAAVKAIEGGYNVEARLESLGIRKGVKLVKISSHFWRGPVTVRIGKSKAAIGYGMAHKIIVEA